MYHYQKLIVMSGILYFIRVNACKSVIAKYVASITIIKTFILVNNCSAVKPNFISFMNFPFELFHKIYKQKSFYATKICKIYL